MQPERLNPAAPVRRISFLEVTHKGNRELLQQYVRYGLGVTNLALGMLRDVTLHVRKFLADITQPEDKNICVITSGEMETYLKKLQEEKIRATSYNAKIMAILHFFNFLLARRYVEHIPFDVDLYLKKEVRVHHDRSVETETAIEILGKLSSFPEEIRLMYLHLWALGLRISEVCALRGDAYYIQGQDTWIKVYQTKMHTYKRMPIPTALYKLMKVYLKKYNIGAESYVFQNTHGGAYCSGTLQKKLKKCCEENDIAAGTYHFESHGYRHTIATNYYDNGVSVQGVRDYLGHVYEEMTLQYIDYMPKKVEKAGEDYFHQHGSLATGLKGSEQKNG